MINMLYFLPARTIRSYCYAFYVSKERWSDAKNNTSTVECRLEKPCVIDDFDIFGSNNSYLWLISVAGSFHPLLMLWNMILTLLQSSHRILIGTFIRIRTFREPVSYPLGQQPIELN